MPPTITLKITDNADRRLAVMSVPVPLSGEHWRVRHVRRRTIRTIARQGMHSVPQGVRR